MSKRCIILGGNGFIGENLLKYLKITTDFILSSFDRCIPEKQLEDVNYIKGDFTNDEELIDSVKNQDLIIHLISTTNPGKSMKDPYAGYNIDVIQTIKILENIKDSNARILFASSGGTVYGEPKECPIKENHELNPISHYGIVKITIEHIINMYNNVYGMNNIIMRISNPYGPGQDYTKGVGVIDAIIKKTINNEKVTIWGDGNAIRDYIYIDDLCEAIKKLCEYDKSERVFNIGSGNGNSINDIINIIEKVLNKKIDVEYLPSRKNDIKHIYLDVNKIEKEVSFSPRINIIEGIKLYSNIIL